MAGSNLLINIGSLDDPNFSKIAKTFRLEKFPVITMTANAYLASIKSGTTDTTAYVFSIYLASTIYFDYF
ncbi:MAG: hypothetical protein ACJ70Z_06515 [Nitrososphaera sp.]